MKTKRQLPKILVADDEQVIRNLFTRFLTAQGYEAFTACDGLDTLEAVKENNYDMLIMDLKMPSMGGMDVLDEIRKSGKDLIIIIITGYGTIETAKKAMREGCFDYITKPFNIDDVEIVIKRAFNVRHLIAEKRKLQLQLERAQRLSQLAQMGAGVAHEVNTVLTSTKLFLEMLAGKLSKTDVGQNNELILEEISRAEKLIARFLDFSKSREPEFVHTDINSVIRKSARFLKFQFDTHRVGVVEDLGENLPQVLCDPAEMEEVFLNALSNSIDAMPHGGTITVRSEVNGGMVIVTIADTGVGIDAYDMPKLFDPFFTAKEKGTGLGLSIAHRIIDRHGGVIDITSEKDKGTIVRVKLPLYTDDHRSDTQRREDGRTFAA